VIYVTQNIEANNLIKQLRQNKFAVMHEIL